MIENIHLWKADRGTYFDRNVNIISWSDEDEIHVGKWDVTRGLFDGNR